MEAKAKKLIKEGYTRQETYELLAEEIGDHDAAAKIVGNIPTPKAWKVGRIFNYTLLIILIFTLIYLIVEQPTFTGIVLHIWFIYLVVTVDIKNYYWISAIAGFGSLGLVAALALDEKPVVEAKLSNVIIYLLLVILLPLFIKYLLCPDPKWHKELYYNEEGEARTRIVYEFDD